MIELAVNFPELPDFLMAARRPKRSPQETEAMWGAIRQKYGWDKLNSEPERSDFRKPQGMPWKEWDRHLVDEAAERKRKSYERLAKLGVKPRQQGAQV